MNMLIKHFISVELIQIGMSCLVNINFYGKVKLFTNVYTDYRGNFRSKIPLEYLFIFFS